MAEVNTNDISLAFAKEDANNPGSLPASPQWKLLEPNPDGLTAGATISRVTRNPISKNRQERKGTISDLDSPFSFSADLTVDSATDLLGAFTFARNQNDDLIWRGVNATSSTFSTGTIPTTARNKLQYSSSYPRSLLYARGYQRSQNNGLKVVNSSSLTSSITVSPAPTAESAPAEATLEVAGIRFGNGQLSLTVDSNTREGTLTESAASFSWTELNLAVGQWIHVGGNESANQFSTGYGYARIREISANVLTLDKIGDDLQTDNGSGRSIDILFGRFYRNVPVDNALFERASYTFELAYPNLGANGETMFQYPNGNVPGQLTLNIPSTDKATATFAFTGRDTPAETPTRAVGAASALNPVGQEALNTTADVGRLRLAQIDEAGLDTDFTNVTVTLNNNITTTKTIGRLGARFVNHGNIGVRLSATAIFSSAAVTAAIRNNSTMTADFALRNQEGAVLVDIPSLTLSGGGKEFPQNETVRINMEGSAFADDDLDTSISFSFFPTAPKRE